MSAPLLPANELTPEALDEIAWEHDPHLLIEWDTARNVKVVTAFGQTWWAVPADVDVTS